MTTHTLRGLVVSATAGLLVAAGGSIAAAAAPSPTSLSIRLVPHASTSTVSGTLFSGRSHVTDALVTLVSEPAGSDTWNAVDSRRTNSNGLVSFIVTPSVRTHYELRFAATSTYGASHSGVVTAAAPKSAVASSLSIRASRTSLAQGEHSQVSGVLSINGSALADRRVVLEARSPGGTWTKERANRTGPHGGVAFVVSPRADRQFRLFFAGDAVGKPSRSGVVTVFVRKATSLSIRESASAIDQGGSAVVSGVLLSGGNPVGGRTVHLLKKTGGSDWTDVGSQSTGPHGGVSFTVSPDATSQYELVFFQHERYNASRSGTVTLTVRPATTA